MKLPLAVLTLALLSSTLAAQAGTGGFRSGDLYLYSTTVPNTAGGGVVHIDAFTGQTETIHVPNHGSNSPGTICYDPWRDRLLVWGGVAPNASELLSIDAAGNVQSLGFPSVPGPSIARMTARGNGIVYMQSHTLNGVLSYLDADDEIQVLRYEDGSAYLVQMAIYRMQYHAPTNSLVIASYSNVSVCPSEIFDSATLFVLELTPDGTRVVSETCFPYEVSSGTATSELPIGLAPGPDGDLILHIDTSSAGGKARMARVDVEAGTASVFAWNDYSVDSGATAGCYSQALNKAVLLDSFHNDIRAFAEGESGAGTILAASGVSTGGSGEVSTLIEVTTSLFGLSSNSSTISLSVGGVQNLFVDLPAEAGRVYWVLGSVTGWAPGLSDGGHVLPLNVDSYFLYTLLSPNSPPLSGALGVLDANGEASAAFTLPAGLDPGLAGAVFHHAALTFDASFATAATTNAVPLELLP